MSTRAVIARVKGDGWEGVYHHSDSYPTGLGCYIFPLIRRELKGDVAAFLKWAIDDHDGGWSHIFPGCVITGRQRGGDDVDRENQAPQCYCDGYFAQRDRIRPGQRNGVITSERPDTLFMEWVYILDTESRTMTILRNEAAGKTDGPLAKEVKLRSDGYWDYGHCAYRHVVAAQVSLDGTEPESLR